NTGTFSYKIVSLAYNNEFNTKLKEFLKAMESTVFPKYEKGPLFEMQVEFKDMLE
ncbi:MAG: TonB C-terminal domain-containing protein, partial [Epsilonproteobacteria bacterium]|nr:TonB C-terminal domain-containing protein [Campylobacterota bacterium]